MKTFDGLGRRYMNVELEPHEADSLRAYLRGFGIAYETSQAGNLIHFEVLTDEVDRYFIDRFLEVL